MKLSTFRPIQFLLLGVSVLATATLVSTLFYGWLQQQRLESIQQTLANSRAFQAEQSRLQSYLLKEASRGTIGSSDEIIREIDELIALVPRNDTETRRQLNQFRSSYLEQKGQPEAARLSLIANLQSTMTNGILNQEQILDNHLASADGELIYSLVVPGSILTILLALLPLTWIRVIRPLEQFGKQVEGLAGGDFTPTPAEEMSQHTLPLHRNFVKLALRLQTLEREQRLRAENLEYEVRSATKTLLEQQQSLARADRLAVAGELAASMAHEIRNPLAAIQMGLSNLRSELQDEELAERAERIMAEVIRLGDLVGETVEFARHDPESAGLFQPAALVEDLFSLTKYQLPSEVVLEHRISSQLQCRLPKERLRQALLNLILNSAQAIGDNPGHIVIEARELDSDLELIVTDDGTGFPDDILAAGIHPFRTTRAKGTGLGLATVRRFVRENGGEIELSNASAAGNRRGARVALLLPSCIEHG